MVSLQMRADNRLHKGSYRPRMWTHGSCVRHSVSVIYLYVVTTSHVGTYRLWATAT